MLDAIPAPDAHARPAQTLATLPAPARSAPHGHRQGRYWVAGDPDGDRGRSLSVRDCFNAMAESFFATLECEPPGQTRFHHHHQPQREIL